MLLSLVKNEKFVYWFFFNFYITVPIVGALLMVIIGKIEDKRTEIRIKKLGGKLAGGRRKKDRPDSYAHLDF